MNDQILWFATRGAGVVSLLLLTAVVCLGVLTVVRWQSPAWPRFLSVVLHRNLALLSVAFLAIHIVTAVIDPYTSLGFIAAAIPFAWSYRPVWVGLGVISLDLLLAVVLTSLVRARRGNLRRARAAARSAAASADAPGRDPDSRGERTPRPRRRRLPRRSQVADRRRTVGGRGRRPRERRGGRAAQPQGPHAHGAATPPRPRRRGPRGGRRRGRRDRPVRRIRACGGPGGPDPGPHRARR